MNANEKQLCGLSVTVKSGKTPNVLEFVSSTNAVDRDLEIVEQSGWQLEHYLKNPVFLNSHMRWDVLHTLGRALVTEVRDNALYQQIEFAVDTNPVARIAHGLYAGGFLRAVSVCFCPILWEEGTKDTPWVRRYLKQELWEVSAVAIPANPQALALGVKEGAVAKSDLQELADICARLSGGPFQCGVRSGECGMQTGKQFLLSLARDLREVLKRA